jgi:hypothetical protein
MESREDGGRSDPGYWLRKDFSFHGRLKLQQSRQMWNFPHDYQLLPIVIKAERLMWSSGSFESPNLVKAVGAEAVKIRMGGSGAMGTLLEFRIIDVNSYSITRGLDEYLRPI